MSQRSTAILWIRYSLNLRTIFKGQTGTPCSRTFSLNACLWTDHVSNINRTESTPHITSIKLIQKFSTLPPQSEPIFNNLRSITIKWVAATICADYEVKVGTDPNPLYLQSREGQLKQFRKQGKVFSTDAGLLITVNGLTTFESEPSGKHTPNLSSISSEEKVREGVSPWVVKPSWHEEYKQRSAWSVGERGQLSDTAKKIEIHQRIP